MKDKDKFSITVEIDNITIAQAIALEDMFATWQHLGGLGCSRWTSFFADGDGNFRPKITVNGRKAQHTDLVERKDIWEGSTYKMDFDAIGWKLHDDNEKAENISKLLLKQHHPIFYIFEKIIGKLFKMKDLS